MESKRGSFSSFHGNYGNFFCCYSCCCCCWYGEVNGPMGLLAFASKEEEEDLASLASFIKGIHVYQICPQSIIPKSSDITSTSTRGKKYLYSTKLPPVRTATTAKILRNL